MWISTGPYDEDEVRARFDPRPQGRAAWDYDIFIVPEERGGLLFVRLWDAAYELLRARGYLWSLSRISSFNLASTSLTSENGRPSRRLGRVPHSVQLPADDFLDCATPALLPARTHRSHPGPGCPHGLAGVGPVTVTRRAQLW